MRDHDCSTIWSRVVPKIGGFLITIGVAVLVVSCLALTAYREWMIWH